MHAPDSPPRHRLAALIGAAPRELLPAVAGFALFFCLFCGYFMLRPIREAMGIAGGVDKLQWLFTATFVVTLLVVPLHGWLSAHVPRRRFIDWAYGFFVLNLLAFALVFATAGESVWAARIFYVWLSVYNLFVMSVAWSLMADVFDREQAERLFAFMAAGASVGGLVGPTVGALLVTVVGQHGLLLLAAVLLAAAVAIKHYLMAWRDVGGAGRPDAPRATEATSRPIAGNPFEGARQVFSSPYLLGISVFVILLATVSTFLYFEQARLVAGVFPDRAAQIRVFSMIDIAVQSLSLIAQVFITGRVARKLGVRALLMGVPLMMAVGFGLLALLPGFAVLAGVMIVRRVGEYAFVRPGREMLFAPMPPVRKYQAKQFIDTVVYRAGDAISGWAKVGLDALGQGPVLVAVFGVGCALAWAISGHVLGRAHDTGGTAGELR